jgi:hypothetical protein
MQEVAAQLAALRRLSQLRQREAANADSGIDSSSVEECSAMEEEGGADENTSPNTDWVEGSADIKLPAWHPRRFCALPVEPSPTALGYVQCFLIPSLIDTIVTSTNEYATTHGAPTGWATNSAEMWLFIKVNIFMGFISLPQWHMYWEEKWEQPQVTRAFARHRFEELQRWWHISPPPTTEAQESLIDKIRPLYEHCQQAFRAFCNPPREMTVDETMVRYKGKSKHKKTVKTKPTPIGYLFYTLASYGYLLAFDLSITSTQRSADGVLHSAVVKLLRPWYNTARIVFFDNLYTSPALCDHLRREGLYSCGTCRPHRAGLPPSVKAHMAQLDKGEMRAWRRGNLQCLAWYSSKPILILSTHHKVDEVATLEGKRGPRPRPGVTKPQVVHDYNEHKCHVDTVDQLRQSYAIQRRHRKTWPSLAWWLVDMCIINAYTLYCTKLKRVISQRDFRIELMDQIWEEYSHAATQQHRAGPPTAPPSSAGHWPKHSHKKRKCVECTLGREGGGKSEVVCELCNVHLCLEPCFKQHHVGHGEGECACGLGV